MPRFDGTGPSGKGQKTGRGMGKCASTTDADKGTGFARGLGAGKGMGAGKGRGAGKGMGNGKGMGAGLVRGNRKRGS